MWTLLLAMFTILHGSSNLSAQGLSDGLIAYWPLDEIQGTKTPDLVNGYDMELSNLTSANVVDGQTGKAFSFSNAEQTLLSRVHNPGEELPANQHESWSLSIWAQVEGTGQSDLRIFSEGNTGDSNPLFNLGTQNGGADGTLDVYLRQSGWSTFGHAFTEQEPFIAGEWHHIVWVQDAGARSLYIDGELDFLEIEPKPEGDWLVNNTSIGGILRGSASHWVTGLLDEVVLWKRALSATEVTDLRDNGLSSVFSPLASGLVSHWPLDEIQGTKTPDLVSNYDMELTNLGADDVVSGKVGSAFSFSNAEQSLLSRVHNPGEDLPINQHESWTLTIWAQVAGTGQSDLRIFSEGNTGDSNPLFNLGTHNSGSDGTLDVFLRQSGWATFGHAFSEQEAFIADEWHHVAWVQDAGSRVIYIDGVLDFLEIEPKPEGDWLVNNTSIGGILRGSASHWVTGLLDEAALWKRALSEAEVNEVMNDGVPVVIKRAQPLVVRSLEADYPAVVAGGDAVLRWDASADATLSIDHGIGDVTATSQFGVGSATVTLDATKTFTLTASRGGESVSSSIKVSALGGVESGWTLLDNFDAWELGSINEVGSWKNPVGGATVVEGASSQALTFTAGEALNALELKSQTIMEGEKTTVFFRAFVDPESEFEGLALNIGATEIPIRFVGDFDDNVGPFVRFDNAEGFGVDIYAREIAGDPPLWLNETLDASKVYNFWLDIDNKPLPESDVFSIAFQAAGDSRKTIADAFLSDRGPGDPLTGFAFPDLSTLFTVAFAGSNSDGLVLFDDFYISNTGDFNSGTPIAVGATEFLPEVDPPATGGAIESIALTNGSVVITFSGTLNASDTVDGTYAPVAGASSPFTVQPAVGQQFYIAQ